MGDASGAWGRPQGFDVVGVRSPSAGPSGWEGSEGGECSGAWGCSRACGRACAAQHVQAISRAGDVLPAVLLTCLPRRAMHTVRLPGPPCRRERLLRPSMPSWPTWAQQQWICSQTGTRCSWRCVAAHPGLGLRHREHGRAPGIQVLQLRG